MTCVYTVKSKFPLHCWSPLIDHNKNKQIKKKRLSDLETVILSSLGLIILLIIAHLFLVVTVFQKPDFLHIFTHSNPLQLSEYVLFTILISRQSFITEKLCNLPKVT